jgi:hypothetical protein
MSENKLYIKVIRWFYMKFDQLIVTADENRIILSSKDNKSKFVRIYIYDDEILVYYYAGFRYYLTKIIPLETSDFELFLVKWIEEKFGLKIDDVRESDYN